LAGFYPVYQYFILLVFFYIYILILPAVPALVAAGYPVKNLFFSAGSAAIFLQKKSPAPTVWCGTLYSFPAFCLMPFFPNAFLS